MEIIVPHYDRPVCAETAEVTPPCAGESFEALDRAKAQQPLIDEDASAVRERRHGVRAQPRVCDQIPGPAFDHADRRLPEIVCQDLVKRRLRPELRARSAARAKDVRRPADTAYE